MPKKKLKHQSVKADIVFSYRLLFQEKQILMLIGHWSLFGIYCILNMMLIGHLDIGI